MRWRNKRRGDRDAGGHVTDGPPAPSSDLPADTGPGWAALPPIASTWSPRSPLTTAAGPPITVSGTPLTQEARRPAARPADGTPDPGRVVGLAAVVVPPLRVEPAPRGPEAEGYFPELPPLRHAAVRPIVVEATPLTRATADFVGGPAAPAPPPPPAVSPFPAPAPIRSPKPPVQEATEAEARSRGARSRRPPPTAHNRGFPSDEPGHGAVDAPAVPAAGVP